jgi:hypothetical protein
MGLTCAIGVASGQRDGSGRAFQAGDTPRGARAYTGETYSGDKCISMLDLAYLVFLIALGWAVIWSCPAFVDTLAMRLVPVVGAVARSWRGCGSRGSSGGAGGCRRSR